MDDHVVKGRYPGISIGIYLYIYIYTNDHRYAFARVKGGKHFWIYQYCHVVNLNVELAYRVAVNTNFTTSNLMYLLLPGKFKIYNMSV